MFCNKLGLDYVSCSPYRVPMLDLLLLKLWS
jgi:phosphoenolpyruvate synthase/pyruvate phosphate dikinase